MKDPLYHQIKQLAKTAADQGRIDEATTLYALAGSIANGATRKLVAVVRGFVESEVKEIKERMN